MKKIKFMMTLGVMVTIVACSHIDDDIVLSPNLEHDNLCEVEMPSPYSLDVMRQAYDYVLNQTRSENFTVENIAPTHRYVKFMPSNRYQLDALNEHYSIYNFPLDSIPHAQPNQAIDAINADRCVYAMIEYNAILPDTIMFEEISVLHNPYDTGSLDVDAALQEDIIKTAYAISMYGNASLTQDLTPWIPSGRVRIWDDLTNDYIPISGLQVHITHNKNFMPVIVETDANGQFEGNVVFNNDVSYIIQWKGSEWAIKFGDMTPAITTSYSVRLPLDLVIPKSSTASYYAGTIYRAASFYWNNAYLCTPPTMSDIVRITCHDEVKNFEWDAVGLFWPYVYNTTDPDIEVWCKNRPTQDIISTTLHELAHAVHFTAVGNESFNDTSTLIKESWTRYIQSILVDDLYEYLSNTTNIDYRLLLHDDMSMVCDDYLCYMQFTPDEYNIQYWTLNSSNVEYSPLFIDITDGFNQRTWYADLGLNATNYPNDKVRVGDVQLVEDLIFNNETLLGIKNDLIEYVTANAPHISISDINDLFYLYEQVYQN